MTEQAVENNQEQVSQEQVSESLLSEKPSSLDFSSGKPEEFPNDFWDEEKKTPAVDKLFNAWNQEKRRADGLRVKLSKGEFEGKAPEDIKEYILELDEKLKPFAKDDDPILNEARKAAKEAGLPKEAFSKFITPVIAKIAEMQEEMSKPLSEEEVNAHRQAEIEKLGPSGNKIVDAVGSFIKQLEGNGTLSEAEAKEARAMANNADAVRVLNKFRMLANTTSSSVPVDVPMDDKASRGDIERKLAEAIRTNNEANYKKYSGMIQKLG